MHRRPHAGGSFERVSLGSHPHRGESSVNSVTIAKRPAAAADTRSVISPGCRMRVLIVGAHSLHRAQLWRFLLAQPDVATVAAAASAREGFAATRDSPIDVAVIDDRLPDRDGLSLTRQLHNLRHPPRVLIYAASPDARLAIATLVAGADGLCDKRRRHTEVSDAVRAVARSVLVLPTIQPGTLRAVAAQVDPQDLPILGMLVSRVSPGDITSTLGISSGSLEARRTAFLRRLALGSQELSASHREPRALARRGINGSIHRNDSANRQ